MYNFTKDTVSKQRGLTRLPKFTEETIRQVLWTHSPRINQVNGTMLTLNHYQWLEVKP